MLDFKNPPKRIITHPGQFHADELLGIALIKTMIKQLGPDDHQLVVERHSVITSEMINNKDILLIDVGGQYDENLLNLDHHQDRLLPAACSLANTLIIRSLVHYKERIKESRYNSEYKDLHDNLEITISALMELEAILFDYVSKVDTGIIVENQGSATINSMMRNWNSVYTFETALEAAEASVIWPYLDTSIKTIYDRKEFRKFMIELSTTVVSINKKKVFKGWRDVVKNETKYLLCPNNWNENHWTLLVKDSKETKIPITKNPQHKQIFCHNSQFLAVYETKEGALAHLKTMGEIK